MDNIQNKIGSYKKKEKVKSLEILVSGQHKSLTKCDPRSQKRCKRRNEVVSFRFLTWVSVKRTEKTEYCSSIVVGKLVLKLLYFLERENRKLRNIKRKVQNKSCMNSETYLC